MTFNELKRRLAHLNIGIHRYEDGVTYFKHNGKCLMFIEPGNGNTQLRINEVMYLNTDEISTFLGVLRIVNKYIKESRQDPKKLFCEKLKKCHLESGNVISTNASNFLITWSGNIHQPIYSVVDLANCHQCMYSVPNIHQLGKYLYDLAQEDSEKDIELQKIYISLSTYFADKRGF